MGCCGQPTNHRYAELEDAVTNDEIIKGLEKTVIRFGKEVDEIHNFLLKGQPLTLDHLKPLDLQTLKLRGQHLTNLNSAIKEIIQVIYSCSDALPSKESKDLIYKVLGNYYLAYDSQKRYSKDVKEFKQFATPYIKIG